MYNNGHSPKAPTNWRFPEPSFLAGAEPPSERSIGALLDRLARENPNRIAVISRSVEYSYADMANKSDSIARGLLAMGIGKGDHVGMYMANRVEWLWFWFAANKIGAAVVGISSWSTPSELSYILRHSDSKMLVCGGYVAGRRVEETLHEVFSQERVDRVGTVFDDRFPFLRSVLVVDKTSEVPTPFAYSIEELISAGEDVNADLLDSAKAVVEPFDVALIPYTSGSTGTPKGVRLVHQSAIENAYNIGEAISLTSQSRYWLVLPLFWSAGNTNTTLAVLTHGATLVLQERFEAKEAWDLLCNHSCTHLFAFANVIDALWNEAAGRTVDSLQVGLSTGQPENVRKIRGIGAKHVMHPYGTTEDYGFATITALGDADETLSESQGHPLPGFDLRIIDRETGETLPPEEIGELLIRGHVTPGYYKDALLNRETFDKDGYFHTGNLASLGSDGRLHFAGRAKEMIKTSGFNVSPVEVEEVLLRHKGVEEAYVVAVPDVARGEQVTCWVKPVPGTALDLDELGLHCAKHLSSYKVPRRILPREMFPMTATGKVSKDLLRQEMQQTLDNER